MKVLFVSSGNNKLGVISFIKSQGESLRRHGVDVDYFLVKGKGIGGYLGNVRALRRHIQQGEYDLVHAHYALTGLVAILATRLPVVVSYMGSDAYGEVDIKGRRRLKSYPIMLVAQIIQPFIRQIIVKSRNIGNYIFLKKKMHLAPNGVDFDCFRPIPMEEAKARLGLSPDKKYILFLGNPKDIRKNHQLLKEAYDLLKDPNVDLLTPFPVDPSLVPVYLNACHVLGFTSYLEGSPNLIKEAMACNTPIVATPSGDIADVISNTEGCYLAAFDKKEVAAKLATALAFGKRTEGRENIRHLEINTVARQIISIYREALGN